MLPFYYLSVTLNVIAGLVLVFFDKRSVGEEPADVETEYPITRNSTFLLLVTLFSGMTAIIKLINPMNGGLAIIGDFLPALSGFAACAIFLDRYLESLPNGKPEFADRLDFVQPYEHIVGIVCLAAAALHFLFSGSVIL